MAAPLFVDISVFQPAVVDWSLYLPWSARNDGRARLSIRATEGTGVRDGHYARYRSESIAEAAKLGIPLDLIHYHFSDPDLNSPQAEADFFRSVVGSLDGRATDVWMLDFEKNVPQSNASWALGWCRRAESNFNGLIGTIYASKSFAEARLQDTRLARYSYTMADWTFDPNVRPSCPLPWRKYQYLQWTDQDVQVPGFFNADGSPVRVDADIFMGSVMGGDYAEAMWLPSPNFWSGNTKDYVVIHGTATCGTQTGYELATSPEFTDGKTKSVHYINDRNDSPVYQVVREHDSAWGNCCVTGNACADGTLPHPGTGDCHDPWLIMDHNYNVNSISIENVKHDCDNADGLTTVQYNKLVALVHDICLRNGIPMRRATDASGGIIGHFDLDPVNKARCPGNFPWDQFLKDVAAGGGQSMLPTGWTDDGTTLTAKNGIVVVRGFRNKVLDAASWDSDDVPNTVEFHADQVLYHRPDLGAGQVQTFRDHYMWFTSTRGVVLEKELGLEIYLRDKKIADLEAQLAAGGGGTPPTPPDTSALKAALDAVVADLQKASTDAQAAETDLSNLK